MPKLTPEPVVTYIVKMFIADPALSYPAAVEKIKARHGHAISIQGVKNIAERECPKVSPKWVKVNPLIKTYRCQFRLPNGRKHLKKFKGQRRYSGEHARFCPEHRTGQTAT